MTTSAQADRLQIVVSFSILGDVVQNVAGEMADVTSLIPWRADPHSFSPSPRDIAAIAEADVVFINGAHFEELLMEAIENAGTETEIFVASSCVPILASGEHHHEEEVHEEHEEIDPATAALCANHDSEIEALNPDRRKVEGLGALYSIECDAHEHGGCDPHVWTDPYNVIYWTLYIRDTLIAVDPSNTEIYTTNAATYIATVDSLAQDFIEPALHTVPEDQRILVTNHETLGYLAAAYGYEIVGTVIPGGGTASEPSAADVAALIELVKTEGISAIFAENTVSAHIAEQVAAESGASFFTLYSDSLSEPDASTYIDYMRYNVTTIVAALGGEDAK